MRIDVELPIIKICVRQMDRKSQTALLRRKRQSMIKLLCNKCNGCASSSSHRFKICGSPKKNATIASEVLCVACNTRSAIRSTSSPAQIEICGGPHSSSLNRSHQSATLRPSFCFPNFQQTKMTVLIAIVYKSNYPVLLNHIISRAIIEWKKYIMEQNFIAV